MKKVIITASIGALGLFGLANMAAAQVATDTAATSTAATSTAATSTATVDPQQAQIAQMLQQIADLKAQLAELQNKNAGLQNNLSAAQQALQLSNRMHQGMSGEDVTRLQQILATDPQIFSAQNVTGFYGPMTAEAVKHFQKHFGLEVVGDVGPKTLEKINELLKEKNVGEQDLKDGTKGDLGDLGDASESISAGEGEHNQNASSTQEDNGGAKGNEGSAKGNDGGSEGEKKGRDN